MWEVWGAGCVTAMTGTDGCSSSPATDALSLYQITGTAWSTYMIVDTLDVCTG